MPKQQPKSAPRRTYTLKLPGELAEYHVTMGAMSGRDIITIRSGAMTEAEGIRLVAERVIEHDFGVPDLLDLDYWVLTAILTAWGEAMTEAALPPATGER